MLGQVLQVVQVLGPPRGTLGTAQVGETDDPHGDANRIWLRRHENDPAVRAARLASSDYVVTLRSH